MGDQPKPRCRYYSRARVQCIRYAVNDNGEIDLCFHHLLKAVELLKANGATYRFDKDSLLAALTKEDTS